MSCDCDWLWLSFHTWKWHFMVLFCYILCGKEQHKHSVTYIACVPQKKESHVGLFPLNLYFWVNFKAPFWFIPQKYTPGRKHDKIEQFWKRTYSKWPSWSVAPCCFVIKSQRCFFLCLSIAIFPQRRSTGRFQLVDRCNLMKGRGYKCSDG